MNTLSSEIQNEIIDKFYSFADVLINNEDDLTYHIRMNELVKAFCLEEMILSILFYSTTEDSCWNRRMILEVLYKQKVGFVCFGPFYTTPVYSVEATIGGLLAKEFNLSEKEIEILDQRPNHTADYFAKLAILRPNINTDTVLNYENYSLIEGV